MNNLNVRANNDFIVFIVFIVHDSVFSESETLLVLI